MNLSPFLSSWGCYSPYAPEATSPPNPHSDLSAISSHFSAQSHAAHSYLRAFADAVCSAWNALTPSLSTLPISQDLPLQEALPPSLHSLPSLSSCLVYCWENPLGEHMLTWSIPSLFPEFECLALLCPPGQVSPSFLCWITAPTLCHLLSSLKSSVTKSLGF